MRIEQIDTDEIVGLKCPITGARILWDDEGIADVLPGTVVRAVVSSLCPEECAVKGLPLAAAWETHYQNIEALSMSLDEAIACFPAPSKALKVAGGGMACGWINDVTYFIVPEELPDGYFIHVDL